MELVEKGAPPTDLAAAAYDAALLTYYGYKNVPAFKRAVDGSARQIERWYTKRSDRSNPGRRVKHKKMISQQSQGNSSNPVATALGLRDNMSSGKGVHCRLGKRKNISASKQLRQLVDDTKVFKQEFRIKLGSDYGLRNWCQIVCRQRCTPDNFEDELDDPPGVTLLPDTVHDVFVQPVSGHEYFDALPPTCKGNYTNFLPFTPAVPTQGEKKNTGFWKFGTNSNNLMFLDMPLTYLEQDMFNMGIGSKRGYGYDMWSNKKHRGTGDTMKNDADLVLPAGIVPGDTTYLTNSDWYQRLPQMMQKIDPCNANGITYSHGQPYAKGFDNNQRAGNNFRYPFMQGWGINNLDYTPKQGEDSYGLIKTNNAANTVATIKTGKISLSVNNLSENQAFLTTLVVVNKHVDNMYYSMPEALTNEYLKAAQAYINSGEWSITNNITLPNANGAGRVPTPDMYITHPRIKPFGKVPTKFLKLFLEHYTIKFERLTKLGIGQRRTIDIELGGLQYSATQLAMDMDMSDLKTDDQWALNNKEYSPILSKNGRYDPAGNTLYSFPHCCQQGTVHLLMGVQGASIPFATKNADGIADTIDKTMGRWATSVLLDVRGKYTEVIKPLTTEPNNPQPIQQVMIRLPHNLAPFVTALPKMSATTDGTGKMDVSRNLRSQVGEPGGNALTITSVTGEANNLNRIHCHLPSLIDLYEYKSSDGTWTLDFNSVGANSGSPGYQGCEPNGVGITPDTTSPPTAAGHYCLVLSAKLNGNPMKIVVQNYTDPNYDPLFGPDVANGYIYVGPDAKVLDTDDTITGWNVTQGSMTLSQLLGTYNYTWHVTGTAQWTLTDCAIKAFYVS